MPRASALGSRTECAAFALDSRVPESSALEPEFALCVLGVCETDPLDPCEPEAEPPELWLLPELLE